MKLPDLLSAFVKATDEKITRRLICTYSESNSIVRKKENIAPNSNIVLRYRMIDYKEQSHVFFDIKKQRSLEKLKERLKCTIEARYQLKDISFFNIHKVKTSKNGKTFRFFVRCDDDPMLFVTVQKKRFAEEVFSRLFRSRQTTVNFLH